MEHAAPPWPLPFFIDEPADFVTQIFQNAALSPRVRRGRFLWGASLGSTSADPRFALEFSPDARSGRRGIAAAYPLVMDRLPTRSLILWLLVCVFALLPSVAQAEDGSSAGNTIAQDLVGRFHYVGGAAEEAQRKAAINVGIESMFFAIRPIARYRLDNATRTTQWIHFQFDGRQLRTRGPDALDLNAPVNGSEVINTWRGEKTRVSQRLTQNGLVQSFIADEGSGRNDWTLSPDGKTLTVKVTIASKHLPKSIVFTQTYRRD
jgi:hypothetical protein